MLPGSFADRGDGEDALIDAHGRDALALCEAFTGQALIVARMCETVLPANAALAAAAGGAGGGDRQRSRGSA